MTQIPAHSTECERSELLHGKMKKDQGQKYQTHAQLAMLEQKEELRNDVQMLL
jgi:hypothetical protein